MKLIVTFNQCTNFVKNRSLRLVRKFAINASNICITDFTVPTCHYKSALQDIHLHRYTVHHRPAYSSHAADTASTLLVKYTQCSHPPCRILCGLWICYHPCTQRGQRSTSMQNWRRRRRRNRESRARNWQTGDQTGNQFPPDTSRTRTNRQNVPRLKIPQIPDSVVAK